MSANVVKNGVDRMSTNILAGKTAMRRGALPVVSAAGKVALDHYEQVLSL